MTSLKDYNIKEGEFKRLKLKDLKDFPANPRCKEKQWTLDKQFKEWQLDKLSESFKAIGVLNAFLVFKKNGQWIKFDCHRRAKALEVKCKKGGKPDKELKVNCIYLPWFDDKSDDEAISAMINMQETTIPKTPIDLIKIIKDTKKEGKTNFEILTEEFGDKESELGKKCISHCEKLNVGNFNKMKKHSDIFTFPVMDTMLLDRALSVRVAGRQQKSLKKRERNKVIKEAINYCIQRKRNKKKINISDLDRKIRKIKEKIVKKQLKKQQKTERHHLFGRDLQRILGIPESRDVVIKLTWKEHRKWDKIRKDTVTQGFGKWVERVPVDDLIEQFKQAQQRKVNVKKCIENINHLVEANR